MTSAQSVELLAPAGNWECARAAVENGADAIYFGLDVGFNARARAANFHADELKPLMLMLHRQGVRGYVTLNTLVFTDELPKLEENIRLLAEAQVDAVLVQDLGVARLVREICPDLEVHASTQMTLTNAASIEVARELGVKRVVLARELSISEIEKISSATDMPIEVFVHGALCVAYSGQCLTSESLGGRSANRGQCAQACRLPYDLFCDDEPKDLGNVRYLLSPQDLAAHDYVPQLISAGVCSLKIEGRLKTPEYVANVCSNYRSAIDAALADTHKKLSIKEQQDLEMSFSRGFSPGWLEGCDHKRLVPGLSSAKRGVLLGTIQAVRGDRLSVKLSAEIATGDGVVLEGDRFAKEEVGGRVYELLVSGKKCDQVDSGMVEIGLQHGLLQSVDKSSLHGLKVWKTDDPKLTKRLRKSFEGADPVKRVPLHMDLELTVGQPVRAKVWTEDCTPVNLATEHVLEEARKHAADESTLREQMSRLGGTVFELGNFNVELTGSPMVPLSVLGKLRKQIIGRVEAERTLKPLPCNPPSVTTRMLAEVTEAFADRNAPQDSSKATAEVVLRVLCRSLKQLEQVITCGVRHVIADFHDIREYKEAVRIARQHDANIELATLRIHKPGEDGLFKALLKQNADSWLVRNFAAMQFCKEHNVPFATDFSLNVTNPLTAEQLIEWGARRITSSYDLNRDQLFELMEGLPTQWVEVVVHQHMPMFHMEHCVFCSVLSPGKNKSDCGRPCDRHAVELRDRVGSSHVLHADIGCRNTLYNGTAQSGAEAVAPLIALGVRNFRIEILNDAELEDVKQLVSLYRDLLAGEKTGTQVWQSLKADNRVGVTRGTMEQPRNPLAIL